MKNLTTAAWVAVEVRVQSLAQHSGLKVQHCHHCGLGLSCGLDSILGPGTSICSFKKKKKFNSRSSLMAQWVKDLALSLLCCGFHPWSGNFCMLQKWQKKKKKKSIFHYVKFIPIFFFFFLWLNLGHMEVPRLGVYLELQLPAYATITATWNPSHICNLYHSSRQCLILNPLSKAGD